MSRSNPSQTDRSITPGADFLQLSIGDAPPGGRADWLARRLRQAISDGRLPVGSRLPASRVLAAELQVSRGVVTEAYQRLTEDGHVAGHGRNGTIVVAAPVPVAYAPAPGRFQADGPAAGLPAGTPANVSPGLADEPAVGAPPRAPDSVLPGPAGTPAGELFAAPPGVDIFDSMRAAPARIDLTPGLPDLAAFPRAAWLRAERSILADLSPAAFGYSDPRGTPALRLAVTRWLGRTRGIRAEPDEVIIVNGVSQALGLLAQVLRAGGTGAVAVEDPGSLGTRQHLRNWGLDTPPVTVDADGVCVAELAAGDARAVLLTPAHQFPTGVVLDGERRRELFGWAERGGLVIEDDYDAEHRYDRPPVPALRAVLGDRVCYAGSVSKLLAPALRVGWLLPPPWYLAALIAAKRNADLGNAVLPQLVLARLMESGELERQLRFVRKRHRRRRDAMIGAIATELPQATVHGAAAGLHLMITFGGGLADGFADRDLAAAAMARGVKVQPLSWHSQRPHRPGLVLGYAANPPTAIAAGVAVLGECIGDHGHLWVS
jgi:GntR family transcriptional regulator/MocR family aminotransferase